MVRIRTISSLVFAGVLVAACGRSKTASNDSALNNDLSLAAQQQVKPMDTLSAAEQGNALTATPNAASPTRTATSSTVRHTTTSSSARRRSSGSSYPSSSSGTTTTTSSPGEVTVKHTQRDAAIGAAAGAVIGATTSKNKVKGGLIGAAVGGILGGVIGNNVDKTKKPPM